jgi:hypothetical protein
MNDGDNKARLLPSPLPALLRLRGTGMMFVRDEIECDYNNQGFVLLLDYRSYLDKKE